jgi:hypothetical protein
MVEDNVIYELAYGCNSSNFLIKLENKKKNMISAISSKKLKDGEVDINLKVSVLIYEDKDRELTGEIYENFKGE